MTAGPFASAWFAPWALLPGGLARDVRIDVRDGRFAAVGAGADPAGAQRLPGVVLPGFANCHSHAFHRALRGRTHADGGTFWTWRERMYALAERLDPDTYLALARAVYAEMALAGVTAVGEFHYLHHGPGGTPYNAPNTMADALREAARDAGIRLTLLDACYLAGGLAPDGHRPLDPVQRRFADRDADAWAERVSALGDDGSTRIGVAAHSVRAVPRAALPIVAKAAAGRPVHVHVSEQPRENDVCVAHYGVTPVAVLADAGLLSGSATAVHATHLTAADVGLLGGHGVTACLCPSTERDLADGLAPVGPLVAAGASLSLGSDQHAAVDLIAEAREAELGERARTGRRGTLSPERAFGALANHASIGWADAGAIAPGCRADLVAVRLDSVRTAGIDPAQVLFAAGAGDVDTVLVDGRVIVREAQHRLGDVGRLLDDAIHPLWPDGT